MSVSMSGGGRSRWKSRLRSGRRGMTDRSD